MKIKAKNVWLMLWDQMPPKRFWKNLIKGHIRRKFNYRSHMRQNGEPKIMYNHKESAMRAASEMQKRSEKRGEPKTYSYYKCVFCDGYHIGSNIYRRDKK